MFRILPPWHTIPCTHLYCCFLVFILTFCSWTKSQSGKPGVLPPFQPKFA